MAVMKIAMFFMSGDVGQQPKADVKIRSNLPAVTLEEAIPDTATDATLLAPQEVQGKDINIITSFPKPPGNTVHRSIPIITHVSLSFLLQACLIRRVL